MGVLPCLCKKMKLFILTVFSIFSLSLGGLQRPRNELTCDICVDIVTDIDEFITSETTEQEILDFFNQICQALDQLIPGFSETCSGFLYNNGPGIIESIVHENLNPQEICAK